jgi:hypothetical protein
MLFCIFRADRKSKVISAPTNFSHVAHMGPDMGMQALIELPKVNLPTYFNLIKTWFYNIVSLIPIYTCIYVLLQFHEMFICTCKYTSMISQICCKLSN